jgi:hypothetical protein
MADTAVVVEPAALTKKRDDMSPGRCARLELDLAEAAGLLLVWSMLVTVEGTIRLVLAANPKGGLTPDAGFPPAALLAGGVAEVTFGTAGILLAVAILLFKQRNKAVLHAFLVVQSVLGWFVFFTYVFAVPLYAADKLREGRFGLALGLDRFLIVLGIVTSVSWCAALQAGQFILAARCMRLIAGKSESRKTLALRAAVWAAFTALAGAATSLTGVLVLAKADSSSPHLPPPAYPPNVSIYPELLVATGLVTLMWGLLGVSAALSDKAALLSLFNGTWFALFFINLVTFALVLGKAPDGVLAFAAAQHSVLSFAYTLLPVIFTGKMMENADSGRARED